MNSNTATIHIGFLAILLFCLPLNSLFGQTVIVDSLTREPINSVHVSYNGTDGLITNEDGYFELPSEVSTDTIKLSHLGYKTRHLLYTSRALSDTLTLEQNQIYLEEVILLSFNTKDTIRKAIKNIPSNYLYTPHNSYGFFRQSLQEDQNGIEMIEVDFTSYLENEESTYSTEVVDARRTENHSQFNFSTIGGVFVMIENGDFVKEKKYFLDIANFDNYDYTYEGSIKDDASLIYKIAFKPKDNKNLRFIRKGFLYVDSSSLAFIEINYEFDAQKLETISKRQLENFKKDQNKLSNKKPIFLMKRVENTIRYKRTNKGKWTLSSIEAGSDKEGKVRKSSHIYTLIAKLIVNRVEDNKVVKIKTNYKLDKDFSKAIRKFDSGNKWKDTYKFSMSKKEEKILEDIINH